MTSFTRNLLQWGGTALLLIGVGAAFALYDRSSAPAAPVDTRPTVPAGDGVITGVVRFPGTPPPPSFSGQGECCPGAPPAPDESVVVNPNHTLANVVVYVKDGPNVATPLPPATLEQKFCRYRPHVLAVHTGQVINVVSLDPVTHNVDIQSTANPPQNFSETTVGASVPISFAHPEFAHVKCDVHPWMNATVAVFDHPFFAVTGADGTFRIEHLPPGTYTLVAWQEQYGELQQQVVVKNDQPATVDFSYQPQ